MPHQLHRLVWFLILLMLASPLVGQDSGWIGQRFMPKSGCKSMVGDREVPFAGLPFTVTKTNGDWLWIGRAWVKKSDVVPLDQAAAYYTEYLRNNPTSSWAYVGRGLVWRQKNELDNSMKDYTEAIRLDPQNSWAYNNRGMAWRHKDELDNALKDFTEAIRLDPQYSWPYHNRGAVWVEKNELDNAMKDFTEAVRLDPQNSSAYFGRGVVWSQKNELDNALKDCTEAIRLDPHNSYAYNYRGIVWAQKNELDNALKDHTEAIRFDPQMPLPYKCRAWIWATATDPKYRDGRRAVESATKACELSKWTDRSYIDTLAAAYAESGNFNDAIKWQTKAIEMAPKDAGDRKKLETRLELYKAGKAYRQ